MHKLNSMKHDVIVNSSIIIPDHEIEISTSRAGGPGGQHVNRTSTRITLRWNVIETQALNDEQKERVLQKLQSKLTTEGDLIIHVAETKSQLQNKKLALEQLGHIIHQALKVAKKRKPTKTSKAAKEARLQKKKQHSLKKKMRSAGFE